MSQRGQGLLGAVLVSIALWGVFFWIAHAVWGVARNGFQSPPMALRAATDKVQPASAE